MNLNYLIKIFKRKTTILFLFGLSANGYAQTLGLNDFLNQVQNKHLGVVSAGKISEGAKLQARQAELSFTPSLFIETFYQDDRRQTNNPSFLGNKTVTKNYSLGFSQQTPFGTTAKLYYNLMETEISGVNRLFVPVSHFYDAKPVLELNQSLWSNGFGAKSRAQQRLKESEALSKSHNQAFLVQSALIEAEIYYWKLALARQTLEVQKQTLERARKIRDWNSKRARTGLADKSDLLQAEANLEMRRLELETASDEQEAAARAFNTARGLDSTEVTETLDRLEPDLIENLYSSGVSSMPERVMRSDVLAAKYSSELASAKAKLEYENNLPIFDVFFNTALNGRNQEASQAMKNSLRSTWATWSAGIKFTTPLHVGAQLDTLDGFKKEKIGAELSYQRKLYELDREWKDLVRKLENLHERYQLSKKIEKSQEEKLVYEKKRLDRGRTTTYQVLIFEQDFAQSQLTRLRYQFDILQTLAKMKLYSKGDLL